MTRIVPVGIEGLPRSPGLTAWDGEAWSPDLRHAIRIWPHQGDTGGFFCAVLEKTGATPRRPGSQGDRDPADDALRSVVHRFGMDSDAIDSFRFFHETNRYVSAVPVDHEPGIPFPAVSTGLSVIRATAAVPKLTTQGAILLGHLATANVMDLDRDRALDFVLRRNVRADARAHGHVLIRWRGHPLGVGLARGQGVGTVIESLYPRTWAGLDSARIRDSRSPGERETGSSQ